MTEPVSTQIQRAGSLAGQGRLGDALAVLEGGLRQDPSQPELLQMLAALAWQAGDRYRADDALKALVAAQGGPAPQTDLMTAQVALDLREFERARAAIDRLIAGGDRGALTVSTAVRLFTWQGEDAAAVMLIEEALARAPDSPELLGLALARRALSTPECLAAAERVSEALPDGDPRKTPLIFARVKAYDRAGEVAEAWALAKRANTLAARRLGTAFSAEACARFDAQLVTRGRASLELAGQLAPGRAHPGQGQIFLIGAPRTGGSLVQSILSAGEGRQSSGERGALLPYLNGLADTPGAQPPTDYLAQLQAADLSGMARGGLTAPLIIDKTTHNFYVAPLIAAIHPGARFVNNRRRARDVALSMYFLDFPPAFPEACDLGALVAMLRARKRLAEIYADAGFDMLDLDFDDFAADPAVQGAQLARALGLEWTGAVLAPENRPTIVPTFSHDQVRQPIARDPGARWTPYLEYLPEEIAEALAALDGKGDQPAS